MPLISSRIRVKPYSHRVSRSGSAGIFAASSNRPVHLHFFDKIWPNIWVLQKASSNDVPKGAQNKELYMREHRAYTATIILSGGGTRKAFELFLRVRSGAEHSQK